MIRSFLLTLFFSLQSFAQFEPTSRLSENLLRVPGVQKYSIRGSESRERILLLYKGIPVLSPQLIPQELIGESEITPVPDSVHYGSHATSGVLSFRQPEDKSTSIGLYTGPRTSFGHGVLIAPVELSALAGAHFERYVIEAQQKFKGFTLTQDLIASGKHDNWESLGSFSLEQRLSANDSISVRSTFQNVGEDHYWNSLAYTHDFAKFLVDWKYEIFQGHKQSELEYGVLFQLPTDGWMIEPGVRYLALSEQVLTSLTASQQTHYRKWIRYSEGGRSPRLSDSTAHPNLKPEHTSTVEIGFLKKPEMTSLLKRNGPSYGVTAFSTHYFHFIKNGANRGEVTTEGIELLTGYRYSVWRAQATAQFLKPQFVFTHDELENTPHQSYTLLLGTQLGFAIFEVQHVYWHQENPLKLWDFNVRTSALAQWNARASVRDFTSRAPQYFLAAQRYF